MTHPLFLLDSEWSSKDALDCQVSSWFPKNPCLGGPRWRSHQLGSEVSALAVCWAVSAAVCVYVSASRRLHVYSGYAPDVVRVLMLCVCG